MKFNIPALIILLTLGSCSIPVVMTKELPPELPVSKQPSRIVYCNQFDYLNNPGIKDKHKAVYRKGMEEFAKSLADDVPFSNPVVIFTVDTSAIWLKEGKEIKINTTEEEIRNKCMAYDADFLLTLDSLLLHFDWDVITERDPDGSKSKTKDFYILNSYFVTLYDATGATVEKTLLEKSMFFRSRPTLGGMITIMPNLDNADDHILLNAHAAGTDYHRLFYPSVEKIIMYLYDGKDFKDVNRLIIAGQYEKSKAILEEMSKTLKHKKAEKAAHNLAVVRELMQNQFKNSSATLW